MLYRTACSSVNWGVCREASVRSEPSMKYKQPHEYFHHKPRKATERIEQTTLTGDNYLDCYHTSHMSHCLRILFVSMEGVEGELRLCHWKLRSVVEVCPFDSLTAPVSVKRDSLTLATGKFSHGGGGGGEDLCARLGGLYPSCHAWRLINAEDAPRGPKRWGGRRLGASKCLRPADTRRASWNSRHSSRGQSDGSPVLKQQTQGRRDKTLLFC